MAASMADLLSNYLFGRDEVVSCIGRATVEERYATLRKQIPMIYLLAFINISGLEFGIFNKLSFGINMPTAFLICALFRVSQWFHVSEQISCEKKLRVLRQANVAAIIVCTTVCIWCIHILAVSDPSQRMAVLLFGGFTAVGVSYGLSSSPYSSRLPLFLLAFPLVLTGLWSHDPKLLAATLSLAIVTALIMRMLSVQNRQFSDLINSRSAVLEQQSAAETAQHHALFEATTDYLTGLRNRRAFISAIQLEIAGPSNQFAVAILDLDRFKWTNDTFGHAAGDDLLKVVAERLERAAGSEAIVSRLGGDEFAVLFSNVHSVAAANAAGLGLLLEVNRPAEINGRQFAISGCVGIGMSRNDGIVTPSRVLADADLALYESKSQAMGRLSVFEPRMEAPLKRRALVEQAMRDSGFLTRVKVAYQPIVDLQTGKILSAEALARWTDKELGEVSPSEFIPLAEQLSLIGFISDHVTSQAITEAKRWHACIRLSINLSAVQLCTRGSAEKLLKRLETEKYAPSRLEVEVTETALLSDFACARENLAVLSEAGIRIVLDDFGSGFASVGYLREIRFDQIKLDGSLVTAAKDSPDGERLLRGVIGLCQALDVVTVAEHIETEQQYNLLLRLGCNAGQGFWFQSPVRGGTSLFSSVSADFLPKVEALMSSR